MAVGRQQQDVALRLRDVDGYQGMTVLLAPRQARAIALAILNEAARVEVYAAPHVVAPGPEAA